MAPVLFTAKEASRLVEETKKSSGQPRLPSGYDLKKMSDVCLSKDGPLTARKFLRHWLPLIKAYATLGLTYVTMPIYFLGDYDLVSEELSGSPYSYDRGRGFNVDCARCHGIDVLEPPKGVVIEYISISW